MAYTQQIFLIMMIILSIFYSLKYAKKDAPKRSMSIMLLFLLVTVTLISIITFTILL